MELNQILGELDIVVGDATARDAYAQAVDGKLNKLKAVMTAAGWPAQFRDDVIAVDASWQAVKENANAAGLSAVRNGKPVEARIDALLAQVQDFSAKGGATKKVATPAPRAPAARAPAASVDTIVAPAEAEKTGDSFLDTLKRPVGPLPIWSWGAIGLGVVVGGYLFLKRK